MRNFLKGRSGLIAYVLFAVAVTVSFLIQDRATHDRREQICRAEIEDRVLILDIVEKSASPAAPIDPKLSPELQDLIRKSRESSQKFRDSVRKRVEIPPDICAGTGIDVRNVIEQTRITP